MFCWLELDVERERKNRHLSFADSENFFLFLSSSPFILLLVLLFRFICNHFKCMLFCICVSRRASALCLSRLFSIRLFLLVHENFSLIYLLMSVLLFNVHPPAPSTSFILPVRVCFASSSSNFVTLCGGSGCARIHTHTERENFVCLFVHNKQTFAFEIKIKVFVVVGAAVAAAAMFRGKNNTKCWKRNHIIFYYVDSPFSHTTNTRYVGG